MNKIAIDVVLLPPDEIIDLAISKNKERKEDPIKLDKQKCIPHITLCMGAINKQKLPEIKTFLEEISNQFSPLNIEINKINEKHSAFDITINPKLQKLHETITRKIKPWIIDEPTTEMCFSPPDVSKRTLYWLGGFKDKSCFENYYPHITLAKEGLDKENISIKFTTFRLALCHLGNYCTCRKILFETKLKQN
jgi:2'-5' RNA ligase